MSSDRSVIAVERSRRMPGVALRSPGVKFTRTTSLFSIGSLRTKWIVKISVTSAVLLSAMLWRSKATGEGANRHNRSFPWGEIQTAEMMLEIPDYVAAGTVLKTVPPVWHFRGYSNEQLDVLFQSASLTPDQMVVTRDPIRRSEEADGIAFHPSFSFIEALSANSRRIIYEVLATSNANPLQDTPFRFSAQRWDHWFDDTKVSEQAVSLTRRVAYMRGATICFSDIELVLAAIPSELDRIAYFKAMTRRPALQVTLSIKQNEHVDPLIEYWGKLGRRGAVEPLLRSLAERKDGGSVDIVELMPAIPRVLLNTYAPVGAMYDCHWSSFNFHSDQADDRYLKEDYLLKTLEEGYDRVEGAPVAGDLLLFVSGGKHVIHSCVYIADDIVFTKNGVGPAAPWVLERLKDVQSIYQTELPVEVWHVRAHGQ